MDNSRVTSAVTVILGCSLFTIARYHGHRIASAIVEGRLLAQMSVLAAAIKLCRSNAFFAVFNVWSSAGRCATWSSGRCRSTSSPGTTTCNGLVCGIKKKPLNKTHRTYRRKATAKQCEVDQEIQARSCDRGRSSLWQLLAARNAFDQRTGLWLLLRGRPFRRLQRWRPNDDSKHVRHQRWRIGPRRGDQRKRIRPRRSPRISITRAISEESEKHTRRNAAGNTRPGSAHTICRRPPSLCPRVRAVGGSGQSISFSNDPLASRNGIVCALMRSTDKSQSTVRIVHRVI